MTDEQAMWRVQRQDDPVAFAELVKRWEGPIKNLCFRMVGDWHRGEDLAQEAFARVFTRRKDFQQASRFSTWLWRIAVNLCRDELRRPSRHREQTLDPVLEDEGDDSISPEPGPDGRLDQLEQADLVQRALRAMPEHYRTVLVLRHYEELKFAEIAEVLEIPAGTVKSRMAEGLSLLARKLRPLAIPCPRPAGHQTEGQRLGVSL
jgi:RNA polymerase sigma-70 factor (ECF subfamily)